MTPKLKAIVKIVVGAALLIAGAFGGKLVYDGIGEIGQLDQIQLQEGQNDAP